MLESLMVLYPFAFYGTAMVLAVAELIVPCRRQRGQVSRRWVTNIGLFALGLVLQRLCIPISVIIIAEAAMRSGNGLLQLVDGPLWITILSGVLLLDLWKYIEHRLSHGVSVLWRLHMVHHSDTDADFTTTERHHPLEFFVGFGGTAAVVYLCGIPPLSVALYLILATAIALFSHANVRISEPADRWLRAVVVTPAVHSVHHSAAQRETDSNFGMLLTGWDRLFGTWRTPTVEDDAARVIGLEYFRDAGSGRLDRVLCLPFLSLAAHRTSVGAVPKDGPRPAP